jgi:hypothetical protein
MCFLSGWWFETCFFPQQLGWWSNLTFIFFRWVETTNQLWTIKDWPCRDGWDCRPSRNLIRMVRVLCLFCPMEKGKQHQLWPELYQLYVLTSHPMYRMNNTIEITSHN